VVELKGLPGALSLSVLRYVTEGAMIEAAIAGGFKGEFTRVPDNQRRARLKLYSPGGRMARELAKNPTVLIVNDTMFAHGGVLPMHVKYGLERLNAEVAAWMRGDRMEDGSHARPPFYAMGCVGTKHGPHGAWGPRFSTRLLGLLWNALHRDGAL
jgi:hypothetical protein